MKEYIDSTGQRVRLVCSQRMTVPFRNGDGKSKYYTGEVFFGVRDTYAGEGQAVMYTKKGFCISHNPQESKARLVSKIECEWDNLNELKV